VRPDLDTVATANRRDFNNSRQQHRRAPAIVPERDQPMGAVQERGDHEAAPRLTGAGRHPSVSSSPRACRFALLPSGVGMVLRGRHGPAWSAWSCVVGMVLRGRPGPAWSARSCVVGLIHCGIRGVRRSRRTANGSGFRRVARNTPYSGLLDVGLLCGRASEAPATWMPPSAIGHLQGMMAPVTRRVDMMSGESVEVTRHRHPIARPVPVPVPKEPLVLTPPRDPTGPRLADLPALPRRRSVDAAPGPPLLGVVRDPYMARLGCTFVTGSRPSDARTAPTNPSVITANPAAAT